MKTRDEGKAWAMKNVESPELRAKIERYYDELEEETDAPEPRPKKDVARIKPKTPRVEVVEGQTPLPAEQLETDHFDFDLAEFPLFRFYKNRGETHGPIVYTDTIRGKEGQDVERRWEVHPGRHGFGGSTTQSLLYNLLQLYNEQGASDRFIRFGTLKALFHRQGKEKPSSKDYARMRRDMDILCGYRFECTNAFWDSASQAYVDMSWNLFNSVFYTKKGPSDFQEELPMGALEVGHVLQKVARTRGFFPLGFDSKFFHSLKPLEQRLAIYLAKKFVSQKTHRRFLTNLAQALPIEAKQPHHLRMVLKDAVEGLQAKGFPLLESFTLERSTTGNGYTATFRRKAKPQGERVVAIRPPKLIEGVGEGETPTDDASLVAHIIAVTGDQKSKTRWGHCVKTLGPDGIKEALSQLERALEKKNVRNPGALLNKICIDIAAQQGKTLEKGTKKRAA